MPGVGAFRETDHASAFDIRPQPEPSRQLVGAGEGREHVDQWRRDAMTVVAVEVDGVLRAVLGSADDGKAYLAAAVTDDSNWMPQKMKTMAMAPL